jgi:hypothetical protein
MIVLKPDVTGPRNALVLSTKDIVAFAGDTGELGASLARVERYGDHVRSTRENIEEQFVFAFPFLLFFAFFFFSFLLFHALFQHTRKSFIC